MKVRFIKVEWDWKAQPDWNKIREFIEEIGTTPYFYEVETNSDDYGVLVSDTKLMDVEVELLWEDDE